MLPPTFDDQEICFCRHVCFEQSSLHLPLPPCFPYLLMDFAAIVVEKPAACRSCVAIQMRSGPLISSVAAVVYITFFSPFICSNWFLQCSCSPTHVLKQEARGGSCSVGVSCSVFLKHLTDTKALIRRSKHTIWYTEVQLRVHIAYNRKPLSAPMVTGLLAHRWHLSSFFS